MALHALVFGGSGISGWAITKNALEYPTPTTFARVTCLSNKPLSLDASALPNDARLQLANGIDLTTPPANVQTLLAQKVPDVRTVTHVFFAAYSNLLGQPDAERATNVQLLRTAVTAVTALAPALQHITLQTGGKWYGMGRPDLFGKPAGPYAEDRPRIPPPLDVHVFYYAQLDALAALHAGAQWSYSELRPNAIVGFAPGAVFMNTALGLAMYLTLQRATHGPGAEVPFPGTPASWAAQASDCSQDVLARAHLFTAVDPRAKAAGPSFNVADAGRMARWADKWAGVCAWFGVRGKGPAADADPMKDRMGEFMAENAGAWDALAAREGLVSEGWAAAFPWVLVWGLLNLLDYDHGLDTGRLRGAGFAEEVDSVRGYEVAFERMRAARQIPA